MNKLILPILLTLVLTACGGGGGGGSATVSPPRNANLISQNSSATITNIVNYPTAGNYNYGAPENFAFGKLGTVNGNCVVIQTFARQGSVSANNIPDAPLYVICQQPNGTFAESSQQLFGQQLNVNGNYPLIADFNNDGIDDIFLTNAYDGAYAAGFELALISNGTGTYVQHQYHMTDPNNLLINATQLVASDINHDGCLDIVFTGQKAMINDCHGNFTQTTIANTNANGKYVFGTGVCAGDFAGTGHDQYIFIDNSFLVNPPNNIVEIDPTNFAVTATHTLPVPYWNTVYHANDATHSFACGVTDINNDGKPDILIFTRPWASYTNNVWTDQSYVQVYLNNGNYNFTDISSTALPNYNTNIPGAYTPRFVDFNGDGYIDIAMNSGAASQVWINNKNNTFTPVFVDELSKLSSKDMLPIKNNNVWDYLVFSGNGIGIATTGFVFK
jgi:FG-GAP-like repeat